MLIIQEVCLNIDLKNFKRVQYGTKYKIYFLLVIYVVES